MNMNKWRVFGLVACLALLGGCSEYNLKPRSPETPLPSPKIKTACKNYCEHARTLNCAEGQPLRNGDSCEKFCEYQQGEGHDLQLACRTAAPNCTVMENCHLP